VNYSRCSVVGSNSETWPMSRARRTLPDKPPLALPIGRRLRRRTVHGVHDVQPREHQELVERVDNGPKDSGQVSIRHAHVGRSGALVGIAAISLAGNSKVARRSAQKEILAGPRLTPLFSIAERSRQSAA
jgi:hypothetical protein